MFMEKYEWIKRNIFFLEGTWVKVTIELINTFFYLLWNISMIKLRSFILQLLFLMLVGLNRLHSDKLC